MTPEAIAKYQYVDKRALGRKIETLSEDLDTLRGYFDTGTLRRVAGRFAIFLAGNIKNNIMAIILGVVTILVGMIVAGILDNQAAASGAATASIHSFSGAPAINNLIPLIIRVVLLMVGIGMIGIGSAGMVGYSVPGMR